jgi:hypothetical protein
MNSCEDVLCFTREKASSHLGLDTCVVQIQLSNFVLNSVIREPDHEA